MANPFLSKKIIIPAIIFFGGLLIAFGVLISANFTDVKLSVASQSFQWTQNAGEGISVPACGSSSASVTCSGGNPVVSFSATGEWGQAGCFGVPSYWGGGWSYCDTTDGGPSYSATWTGASSNTSYTYGFVEFANQDSSGASHTEIVDSFTTPNCAPPPGDFNLGLGGSVACNSVPLSWAASSGATAYRILRGSPRVDISPYQPYTALNFTDTTVNQNTTYQYQIEAYNPGGTNRSNTINVATPFCPPTLNFSAAPTSIFQGQSSTLTWNTAYATSCTASSAPTQSNWSGSKAVNGSQVVVPLPPPAVTYNLQCSGSGGTTSLESKTVNITPLALPEFREIIPR